MDLESKGLSLEVVVQLLDRGVACQVAVLVPVFCFSLVRRCCWWQVFWRVPGWLKLSCWSAALFFWFTAGCAAESSFGLLFCLAGSGCLGCCVSLVVGAILTRRKCCGSLCSASVGAELWGNGMVCMRHSLCIVQPHLLLRRCCFLFPLVFLFEEARLWGCKVFRLYTAPYFVSCLVFLLSTSLCASCTYLPWINFSRLKKNIYCNVHIYNLLILSYCNKVSVSL